MQTTGKDVLHSDTDAMWLKNPDPILTDVMARHPGVHIIASQNSEPVPGDVLASWGFVLNTGFIFFKNSPQVRELGQLMSACTGNEQVCLNKYLMTRGCSWTPSSVAQLEYVQAQMPGDTAGQEMLGDCNGITVVALSHSHVSRSWCNQEQLPDNDTYVRHLVCAGPNASTKLNSMRHYGLCS